MNAMDTAIWKSVIVAGVIGWAGVLPVAADLPELSEKEWLGHFVGFNNNKLQFGVTSRGKTTIRIIKKNGEPIAKTQSIPLEFQVEEVMPDGKTKVCPILPETLQSAQPATDEPRQVVIQGKVKGGAGFEIYIDEKSGMVSLGGRLLDRGTLTKNPLRFSIKLKIPDAYPNEKHGGSEKVAKAFEEKTEDDRLLLKWTDGKRVKPALDKSVDAGSKEINGPGISSVEVEFSSYYGRKLEFTASENSAITLSGARNELLRRGFSLIWVADLAKDPEGKARLGIEAK